MTPTDPLVSAVPGPQGFTDTSARGSTYGGDVVWRDARCATAALSAWLRASWGCVLRDEAGSKARALE